ncbi:major facilitator superfamily domain-containing protein [Zychaea mexicana]|uniref:major facilitator superfamily domain-containing protein n=1 Tax=Zychaea mexicana TaxID=64656 RepID=UPI0022FEAA6E|nr:major facilitator superfamily domain-containing protein [Zychaea mexicana]KAI9499502.1 major facilitator superfamily domain-containing protein [Zychaea mexicana]
MINYLQDPILQEIFTGTAANALTTQLLSAPPAAVTFLVILLCGFLADRGNKRAVMVSSGAGIMVLGYTMLMLLRDRWACYAALFIIAAGIGVEAPVGVSWSAINYPDLTVRAVAVALVNMMGNFGNVIASFIYTVPGDTNHTFGHTFNLISALGTAFFAVFIGLLLRRQNRRLEQASSFSYVEKSDMQQRQRQFRVYY